MSERASIPKIFPPPHSLFLHGGFLKKGKPEGEESHPNAFRGIENFRADVALEPSFGEEEFSITIDATDGVKIRFGKGAERFAAETFSQIFEQSTDAGLPCLTLRDFPDFPERGFMLDVSRGRVPTMHELFSLVEFLSRLRFNRFQLYIEHTFAFKDHEEVWRSASPLTAEEIRELDRFCCEHGIELVPNLNSFGHVDRWLKHDKYKHLAECPDGFFHEVYKTHRVAGTFRACEETADFMGELYREFLPNFSSEIFNVGGDEPWELGQGRSREECERRGKRVVYLEHMERLRRRAASCGKRIMFWADILLENSSGELLGDTDFAKEISKTIPAIWGYEKGHPFAEQCTRVANFCKDFYVVPGTSAWLSFTGRLDNALANISEAISAGFVHGAHGVMLTTWGDLGYHNPFCLNLLPLLACSSQSWNSLGGRSPDLLGAFERFVGPRDLATVLFYLGRIDNFFAKKIKNRSIVREFLFTKKSALQQLLEGVSMKEIVAARSEVRRLFAALAKIESSKDRINENISSIEAEIALSLEMSDLALCRVEAFLKGDLQTLGAIEKEISGPLAEKFATVWVLRDRPGGLRESLEYFRRATE